MLKKIRITIMCMLACLTSVAQTYTVTRQDLGLTGSLDVIMTQAIIDANSSGNVTILFDAPGLVQVDNGLPVLDILDGSITFDKKIGGLYSHLEQGVQFATLLSSPAVGGAFQVFSNTEFSSVSFKHLKIIDFIYYFDPLDGTNNVNRNGIALYAANNIVIENCIFENNTTEIHSQNSINVEISSNTINHPDLTTSSISFELSAGFLSTNLANIHHNTITTLPDPSVAVMAGIVVSIGGINQGQIKVEDNTVNYFSDGISIDNHSTLNEDPLVDISVKRNTVEGSKSAGIDLLNPLSYWKIEDNILNSNKVQIGLVSIHELPNIYGINFIESNTLGFTLSNEGNVFGPDGELSFWVTGDFGAGNKLIGLELTHVIQIVESTHTIIRQTKITEETFFPIELYFGSNGDITPPMLKKLVLTGTNLEIDFELSNLDAGVGDYVVDFYRTGPDGGLLDYLGSQTQVGNGTYTANITVSGAPLNYGDWIMATVTSLATHTGSVSIGTSYAMFEQIRCPGCLAPKFCYPEQLCAGVPATFENRSFNCAGATTTYLWDYGDGTAQTSDSVHTYATIGNYIVKLILPASSSNCYQRILSAYVTVTDDCILPCQDCITSFAPIPGQQYVISAWVQQANSESSVTYETPSISLEFTNNGTLGPFVAKGEIIDGWQRIDETFTVPGGATDVYVKLTNGGVDNTVYFDDIRIHPLKASLKSFVYDAISMRLMAELDENNYATFYEYDEEGKLIRIKKETERGVKTIKESVNSTHKTVQ